MTHATLHNREEITRKDLAEHFGTLDALLSADENQIRDQAGVGSVVARSVVDFLGQSSARNVIAVCQQRGLQIATPEPTRRGPFAGKTVVFTGTLNAMPRAEAEAVVRRLVAASQVQ